MFYSKKLKQFKNLRHCFFSRKNGISKGIYESLNCGLGSNDKKENVFKNLKIVSNKIDCNEKSIITLNQIHSNNVVHLEKENYLKRKLSGDAIITQKKNIAIAVLTADCVPILFYDSKKKIIGCIHSGWKGGLNGIIEKTINKLNALNCNVRDLNFAIGPCIGKKDYEVGFDFYEKFIAKSANNDFFFEKKSETKYFFDLRAFINSKLLSLNIKNIDNLTMNTFSDEKNFYSYRRSCLNNEKDYGRCISVILMT